MIPDGEPRARVSLSFPAKPGDPVLGGGCGAIIRSRARSTAPVVELWEVEGPCPFLAAPRIYLGLRRKPLIKAVECAFLHINDARAVLQVVGDEPGAAVGAEDAVEPLARTCLGVRTVGEALGGSAEHEIRVGHRSECRHLAAGGPLAIGA